MLLTVLTALASGPPRSNELSMALRTLPASLAGGAAVLMHNVALTQVQKLYRMTMTDEMRLCELMYMEFSFSSVLRISHLWLSEEGRFLVQSRDGDCPDRQSFTERTLSIIVPIQWEYLNKQSRLNEHSLAAAVQNQPAV